MADELDVLIDGALAEYANPEPLAGLEQRVIGRARAARPRRWWWAAAIPVAAGLVLMLAPRHTPKPAAVAVVQPVAVPAPAPPRPEMKTRRAVRRKVRFAKRSTFPTVTPLTDQERLLIELAKSNPEQLLYRAPDVIEVKPIEIAPLETDARQ